MEAVVSGYALIGACDSFAIKISDKYGNVHERVVPLKSKSKYQAELAAVKYVLQVMNKKNIDLIIKTSVAQVPQIFEKTKAGTFLKRKRQNDLIDDIRELSSQFSSFQCVIDKDSEEMLEVKEKAKLPSSI